MASKPKALTQGKMLRSSSKTRQGPSNTVLRQMQDLQKEHRRQLIVQLPLAASKKQYAKVDKIIAQRFPELTKAGLWKKSTGFKNPTKKTAYGGGGSGDQPRDEIGRWT